MFRFESIRIFRRRQLTLFALLLTLAGCGGSGGSSGTALNPSATGCDPSDPTTAAECGSVLIAVTDAEGDFTSYAVDVLSIALERANGSWVETLPASTRIDFAQLTELSELLSAATLAPGDIVGGRIRLDYSNAEIYVEAGGQIVPAEIVDANGQALTTVDFDIRLADRDRLIVTRGRTAFLSIDFDLAASHSVDTAQSPPLVVAEPYLVAELGPIDQKQLRVRGSLIDVDATAGTYDIRLRPWFDRVGDHGRVTIATTATTEFEIDELPYVGQAGLDALALEPAGTLTVAFGTLDLNDRSFTAEVVHAGDSLGGGKYTAVYGNIVGRSGDQLVVKGGFAVRSDRPAHFQRSVLIDVGPDTGVARDGAPGVSFDKDDLSVGQRIVAFGELSNPDVLTADPAAADTALELDATEGRVRMLVTRLSGTVVSIVPGQLNLDLAAIDHLGIDLFDFAGTGIVPADDADPTDYEVTTGTLALDALEVGRPARALGFVNRFGAAPPDFTGRTLVGHRDIPAALGVGWTLNGTAAPFTSMGPAALVVDLANMEIGTRHHMLVGPRLVDLFDLPASPSIEPQGVRGLYGIQEPGHVELFTDFTAFVDELALRLGGADRARSLAAYGRYDESGNTLTAGRIVVHMLPGQ
jgi:hypothetical protein